MLLQGIGTTRMRLAHTDLEFSIVQLVQHLGDKGFIWPNAPYPTQNSGILHPAGTTWSYSLRLRPSDLFCPLPKCTIPRARPFFGEIHEFQTRVVPRTSSRHQGVWS